jgi:3-phytase
VPLGRRTVFLARSRRADRGRGFAHERSSKAFELSSKGNGLSLKPGPTLASVTVAESSVPPTAFAVNGLVELLPFNDEFMLSMERSASVGAPGTGITIKLYTVAFPGAGDVSGLDSIAGVLDDVRPVEKEPLLDLGGLGIPLDNVEGITVGPELPDGRRSLLLVSDNDFAVTQFTQFLLFALD